MTPTEYDNLCSTYDQAIEDFFDNPSNDNKEAMQGYRLKHQAAVRDIIAEWRHTKPSTLATWIKRLRKTVLVMTAFVTLSFAHTRPVTHRDIAKSLMTLAVKANKNGMPRVAVKIDKLALEVYAAGAR